MPKVFIGVGHGGSDVGAVSEKLVERDINLVMASLMIGAFMLILGNLLADILLKLTDPRVRV